MLPIFQFALLSTLHHDSIFKHNPIASKSSLNDSHSQNLWIYIWLILAYKGQADTQHHIYMYLVLGKGHPTKTDEFSEKFFIFRTFMSCGTNNMSGASALFCVLTPYLVACVLWQPCLFISWINMTPADRTIYMISICFSENP